MTNRIILGGTLNSNNGENLWIIYVGVVTLVVKNIEKIKRVLLSIDWSAFHVAKNFILDALLNLEPMKGYISRWYTRELESS